MIHLLQTRATKPQIDEMLETLKVYIKLAVDIDRGILAGGGALHADCESVLIADGSKQENVWGADWIPLTQEVTYEALINIRPHQNNPSMTILDEAICKRITEIIEPILGGV